MTTKQKMLTLLSELTGVDVESLTKLTENASSLMALGKIQYMTNAELKPFGITTKQAAKIHKAFEFGMLFNLPTSSPLPAKNPNDIAACLKPLISFEERECMAVIGLTTRHTIKDIQVLYRGCTNSIAIEIKTILGEALKMQVGAIVIAHNHPSGDCSPSQDDLRVTARLVEAGKLMDVEVIDHLIVSGNNHYSMRERGHIQ